MKGVTIRRIKLVNEDDRRRIMEIMNGEMSVKNLKILYVKKGEQLLGNHWHQYPEVMCIIKGSAIYKMRNIDTKEEEIFNLTEGDVVFRTGRITHAGFFSDDSIIMDGATESYISADFNDVGEKIL
jgi:mannose-6-phosphate isomerase-like protein (cupin superfamily)